MRKQSFIMTCLLIVSLLMISALYSCDKETRCDLAVKVVNEADGTAVPHAKVWVGKSSGETAINSIGYTNQTGTFETSFSAPAIFDVEVQLDSVKNTIVHTEDGPIDTLTGMPTPITKEITTYTFRYTKTSVRLKEGEKVGVTVKLPSTPYEY